MTDQDTLAHYTRPGRLTGAGAHHDALRALPADVPALFEAVQGLVIHEYLPDLYGLDREPGYTETAHLRSVEHILGRLLADGRPLTERREPADRFGGCCCHFTVIAVAALRAHGVPARARCGFATYFQPDWYEDHWVVERWDADRSEWILSDPQIDSVQKSGLPVAIDPLRLTRDEFVVGGEAWRRYREGRLDPDHCGFAAHREFGGLHWIVNDHLKDVAALAGMEMLPWDFWGPMVPPGGSVDAEPAGLLDRLASLTADPETAADVRAVYESEPRLQVPEQVNNFVLDRIEPVVAP
ncbi:transglutaminase-like domain-containing protein [Glycomyces xiaoerkulensis]|uniref:transglutaminase-like domain-containing protein n=1 Tax=Glycomyces xiaoerkulensis TaxID=2038139 RepID=UPI0012FFF661|nr:transglutaminase-like domain-containing protein [Glycomyces xiaoerkulensis]